MAYVLPQALPYRPAVGLVIVNRLGKVLTGKRTGATSSNAWQLPQGGRDGDDPETAAWRELAEELGLTRAEVNLAGLLPCITRYDYPAGARVKYPGFRGQEHTWAVFHHPGTTPLDLPDLSRATDKEFDEVDWMRWEVFLAFCPDFKFATYREIHRHLMVFLKENPR